MTRKLNWSARPSPPVSSTIVPRLRQSPLLPDRTVKEPDPALSRTSEAVVNAILSLAVVTESLNGATRINEVIALQKDISGDDEWYNTELYGVAAGEVWRGPIWLAVAIWQKLRDNYLWRVPFDDYDEESQDDRLELNNGELLVYPYRSYEWDTAFEIIVDRARSSRSRPP